MDAKTSVEKLSDTNDLWGLETAFLAEIGEAPMDAMNQKRLENAIRTEKIIFFIAKKNGQPVGMCSVSPCFSTFACKSCGVFDDFFVKPDHRGQGIARALVKAAREWCEANDCASMMVGCSKVDAGMYQSLGFDTALGLMLAANL